jgi:nucleoside 2-deoxyribosyltransferase
MTLTIVGGWYEEVCGEPRWQEFYGPGGRAAAALTGRKAELKLLTYCPQELRGKLDYFAKSSGFEVECFGTAPAVPRFEYLHWLRPPQISPGSASASEVPPICVEAAENVIRYGFYEGDAIIKAKRAVYDPQNAPEKICHFSQNGSTADELAIVCNFAEGSKLTGETSPERILQALLKTPKTIAVALKGAWEGVWIADQTHKELIKPTPTTNVHKIGSGDVFTAEFGYGWMILGLNLIEAARRASIQVACYTNSGSLPIPETGIITPAPAPLIARRDGTHKKFDIYIAGPFFNYSQLSVVEEMANLFSNAGLTVFSPYHDVGFGHAAHIAKKDLDALCASRIVVACLDGFDPGTVFEVGYARAKGIPVLVYSPNLSEQNATMFVGSGCVISSDFTTAIYRAVWWARSA